MEAIAAVDATGAPDRTDVLRHMQSDAETVMHSVRLMPLVTSVVIADIILQDQGLCSKDATSQAFL